MKSLPALLTLVALPLLVGGSYLARPQNARAQAAGARVPDFTLQTTDGAPFRFYSLAGKKAAVLFFVGADCPISKLYLPRLQELSQKYAGQGVAVVGVDSNRSETAAQMARAAQAAGVTFPIVMDPQQKVADAVQVARTCEAVLVDGTAQLRFKGAVDNQYGFAGRKAAPSEMYLASAIDALLSGKAVPKTGGTAAGCLLDRLAPVVDADAPPQYAPDAPLPKVGKVTWAADVAPILQEKCQSCHRAGQVAPFALNTYADARRWAAMIGETVQTKRMPPWQSDPRHGDFVNDRSLSAQQKATILVWVKQGAPQGDLAKAPVPKRFTDGWNIAKPDVVFKMDKPFAIPATGVVEYQWFRIPTHFTEDTWIQASEVKPGARSAVHHVLVFVDDHTSPKPTNGLDGFVGEYVPGESPMILPDGIAKRIPAGADLLFQVHYSPTGTALTDQTELGFVLAKAAPKATAETVGVLNTDFHIPAGADNFRVERTLLLPLATTVYAYSPHMHKRGKAFRLSAMYPDGTKEILLSVPRYDFNWQTRYQLKTPKTLPKGTKVLVEAWYDNSAHNPYNPDATKAVDWGEQTTDEMMIGYLDYTVEGNKPQVIRFQNALQLRQQKAR